MNEHLQGCYPDMILTAWEQDMCPCACHGERPPGHAEKLEAWRRRFEKEGENQ